MPRPLVIPPNASPMVKRLFVIMNEGENGKPYSAKSFGKKLNMSDTAVLNFINGEVKKTSRIISDVPAVFGYASEWWLHGTGPKKKGPEQRFTINDIKELSAEINLVKNLNLRLQSRMDSYEKEIQELKKRIDQLEQGKG
jgi:hypothetical protein